MKLFKASRRNASLTTLARDAREHADRLNRYWMTHASQMREAQKTRAIETRERHHSEMLFAHWYDVDQIAQHLERLASD